MKLIRKGSTGEKVRHIQKHLDITVDGIFGDKTERAVIKFQYRNALITDGIVGPKTWAVMFGLTTDVQESLGSTHGIDINNHMLAKGEYLPGPTQKEWLFIHHTAGWHNPYRTVDHWSGDNRGRIATEFVIGGPSIYNDDFQYDGDIVRCLPDGAYAWHLGKNGEHTMHTNSVGIEVCNFGYLKDGRTYAGSTVHEDQIVELDKKFKGYKFWHKYSDAQIEALRRLILFIADRDNIDVRKGLPELIKQKGADAFEWNEDAYYGKIKGLWSHSNTNKGKSDMFPQENLLTMLTEL
jgi:hypothetical protein|tara:strand:- start:460 stop:1341 length:882 start_codon:yes stop_codon:yes gene_type:complete